jgi:hypothetical protein
MKAITLRQLRDTATAAVLFMAAVALIAIIHAIAKS